MRNLPKEFWRILAAGIFIRLLLVLLLPLYPSERLLPGYNDEPLHLHYVEYVADNWRWPVWTRAVSDSSALVDEFPQPPFYYFLAAPAYRLGELFGISVGIFSARLISLLLGALTCVVVFWIGKTVFGGINAALAGMAFASFSPNMVTFTSLITNDALLILFSTMTYGVLISIPGNFKRANTSIRLGLLFGMTVWAKMSALSLFPLAWFPGRSDRGMARVRTMPILAIGIAVLIIMPLILWNISHYEQLVPTVSIYTPEESGAIRDTGFFRPITSLKYLARTTVQPFDQVWGGWLEKLTSVLWLISFISVLSVGVWKLRSFTGKWLVYCGVLLPLGALMVYNFRFFQIEARLLAPATAPLAIIASAGMSKLKVPLMGQCAFWVAPLVILFVIRMV